MVDSIGLGYLREPGQTDYFKVQGYDYVKKRVPPGLNFFPATPWHR